MKSDELVPSVLGAIFGSSWPLIKGHPQIRTMMLGIQEATKKEPEGVEGMRQRLIKVVSEPLDVS